MGYNDCMEEIKTNEEVQATGGKPARMKSGLISVLGQIFVGASAIALWVVSAYFDANLVGMILGGLCFPVGVGLLIYGRRVDLKNVPDGMLPPLNSFLQMGGFLIGLGAIGLLFIIILSEWSNTAWVVVEVLSVAIGALFAIYGWNIEKKLRTPKI